LIALTVALAVLAGIALGLLGGGGSILTVPLLAYVAGMDTKHAIATSLLVVGVTSAIGAVSHARAGRVQWRTGLLFGAAGMTGAYAGGLVARFIPGPVLLIAFAGIMVAAAIAMLRGRHCAPDDDGYRPLRLGRIALYGVGVGLVSGLVGAGGGFLLVPALVLLAGLPMPTAVGTSLVVIAMQSFAGLAGHLASVQIDWRLATTVTAAAVAGGLVGGRLTALVDATALRKVFGWFVLLMASLILTQEAGPAVGGAVLTAVAVGALVYMTCTRTTHCPIGRLTGLRRAGATAN